MTVPLVQEMPVLEKIGAKLPTSSAMTTAASFQNCPEWWMTDFFNMTESVSAGDHKSFNR
jgi:hypothetical protein